jgi:hypothetical protein
MNNYSYSKTSSWQDRPRRYNFSREIKQKAPEPEPDISTMVFPELTTQTTQIADRTGTNYKNILTNIIEVPKAKEPVKPGWVRINCKTRIYEYGPPTKFDIVRQKNEELSTDINHNMNKAIDEITRNQQQHIDYYNAIHGEGEYEEKYIIEINHYEDDDDDEEEEEEDNDE